MDEQARDDRVEAALHVSAALAERGDLEAARASLEGILVDGGERYEVLAHYGLVLHLLGHHGQAVSYLRRALALRADDPNLLHSLGLCLTGLNRWGEALTVFKQNWDAQGDRYWTALMCGVSLSMLARSGDAIGWFQEAYDAAESGGGPRANSAYLVGYALCLCGRWEEATPFLREATARLEGDVQFARLLALATDTAARTSASASAGEDGPLSGWDPLPDRWLKDAAPPPSGEPPYCE
ncbi:MAG: tetratricopeptide repeat protein [Planctomycetes bacterium]|nr:tetratricopeptide repeat protein [Planctomycetota bacterium]